MEINEESQCSGLRTSWGERKGKLGSLAEKSSLLLGLVSGLSQLPEQHVHSWRVIPWTCTRQQPGFPGGPSIPPSRNGHLSPFSIHGSQNTTSRKTSFYVRRRQRGTEFSHTALYRKGLPFPPCSDFLWRLSGSIGLEEGRSVSRKRKKTGRRRHSVLLFFGPEISSSLATLLESLQSAGQALKNLGE